ncbi:ORF113 [Ranid herpesvirus 1]|uniref:ORF113 n=1 Tax=Ranid herpesvirus 1 TaxID=85655 RepID=Q14VL7_9VIRU|nr:ORF113 [Ranid herpesvirus 1]ABG25794.1 ORF113 [Ranid herpesvirus 1]
MAWWFVLCLYVCRAQICIPAISCHSGPRRLLLQRVEVYGHRGGKWVQIPNCVYNQTRQFACQATVWDPRSGTHSIFKSVSLPPAPELRARMEEDGTLQCYTNNTSRETIERAHDQPAAMHQCTTTYVHQQHLQVAILIGGQRSYKVLYRAPTKRVSFFSTYVALCVFVLCLLERLITCCCCLYMKNTKTSKYNP